jgi:aminoglycoside phosphotransferase (APT) family kinase protein
LDVDVDDALDRMLQYWRLFLEHVESNGEYPELSESVSWLCDNRPLDSFEEGLVWGDASLRNMLFEDLEVSAMLDFEFAHYGVVDFDITFYAMMDHIMAAGFAGGARRLKGFPGMQSTLDHYEATSGRPIRHREYWLRTALTYSALSTTRVFQRLAAAGVVEPADVGANPPLVMLRSILEGIPLPD